MASNEKPGAFHNYLPHLHLLQSPCTIEYGTGFPVSIRKLYPLHFCILFQLTGRIFSDTNHDRKIWIAFKIFVSMQAHEFRCHQPSRQRNFPNINCTVPEARRLCCRCSCFQLPSLLVWFSKNCRNKVQLIFFHRRRQRFWLYVCAVCALPYHINAYGTKHNNSNIIIFVDSCICSRVYEKSVCCTLRTRSLLPTVNATHSLFVSSHL